MPSLPGRSAVDPDRSGQNLSSTHGAREQLARQDVASLYQRYGFQVERRCKRILSDPTEAEDAVQDVFIRLIRHGGAFRGDAEWMTWLYRVATNVCLNYLRSRKRRITALQCFGEERRSDAFTPPKTSDRRDVVVGAIRRTDRKTQQIVIHYFFDEMTQGEIAELIGISRVSVNRKLQRFRRLAQTES